MNKQDYDFFESKLFKGIIIIGSLVALAIIYAYGVTLTGNWLILSKDLSLNLSKKSGNWGDFGSLLSGAFTLLTAIFSLATLIFLLKQQEKNEINNTEQLKLQKEIQEKNDIHFGNQKELMNFEMYKIHQDMFDGLLDKIEMQFNKRIKFTSRSILYKYIFPKNGFQEFKASANYEYSLKEIECTLLNLVELLPSVTNKPNAVRFFMKFSQLNEMLGIWHDNRHRNYDVIIDNSYIGLNVMEIKKSIATLYDVINQVMVFSEQPKLKELVLPDGWYITRYNFLRWGINSIEPEDTTTFESFTMTLSKKLIHPITLALDLIDFCDEVMQSACFHFYTGSEIKDMLRRKKDSFDNADYIYLCLFTSLQSLEKEVKYAEENNAPSEVIHMTNEFINGMYIRIALRN